MELLHRKLSDTLTVVRVGSCERRNSAVLVCVLILGFGGCSSGVDHVTDETSCKDFLKASRDAQRSYAEFARDEYNKQDALRDPRASLDLVRRAFVEMCKLDLAGTLTMGDVRANRLAVPLYVNDPPPGSG